jgi:hypothetical protein
MFRSADEFFDIEDLCEVKYKSREKLISMRIEDFLALAEHGFDPDKAGRTREIVRSGGKFPDTPGLLIAHDGEVARIVGHEGRHRARALLAEGYTHMPVMLLVTPGEVGYSIRWSEQYDPGRFDYAQIWPSILEAEYGSLPAPDGGMFQIPFPVTRADASAPYSPCPWETNPDSPQEPACMAAAPMPSPNTSRAPRMR